MRYVVTVRRRHERESELVGVSLTIRGTSRAVCGRMAVVTKPLSITRIADHPRFLETVVGRLLELVVHSVEGIRDRITPARIRTTVH